MNPHIRMLLFCIILFGIPAQFLVLNTTYYNILSAKHGTNPDHETFNEDVTSFLKGSQDRIPPLTPKELSHMHDVRTVMHILFGLYLTALLTLLYTTRTIRDTIIPLQRASIITLGILLVLALAPFDWLFTAFHAVLFEDGTWTFSHTSTLIQTYPYQFFIEFFITILVCVSVLAVACLIACTIYRVKSGYRLL